MKFLLVLLLFLMSEASMAKTFHCPDPKEVHAKIIEEVVPKINNERVMNITLDFGDKFNWQLSEYSRQTRDLPENFDHTKVKAGGSFTCTYQGTKNQGTKNKHSFVYKITPDIAGYVLKHKKLPFILCTVRGQQGKSCQPIEKCPITCE